MDKVTCIAFILYQSTNRHEMKEIAIQLLNGDVSLRDLQKDRTIKPQIVDAETRLKKNKINKSHVQAFAERFLLVEA